MLTRILKSARTALAAAALAMAGVPAAVPVTAQALPGLSQRDRQVGAEGYRQIVQEFGGKVEGPLADYVRGVGTRIALASVPGSRPQDWTVTVLDSPVPNAMATPGGYLYITRGLLAMMNSEAELASVLGHEAGHVAARHSDKRNTRAAIGTLATIGAALLGGGQVGQIANVGANAWVAGFSRDQEREADTLGMRYAIAAGYDPMAAATMLQALERVAAVEGREAMERRGTSLFSTHPVTAERVQRVAAQARQTGRTGAINREAFLSAIDGMAFGDAAEQGIVSGSSFRHAGLRLGFDAPPGFQLQNSPQAVAGRGPDGSQFLFTSARVQPGQSLQDVVRTAWQQNTGSVPQARYSERRINSFDAGLSDARVNSRQGPVDAGVHVFRAGPGQAWLLRTVAPAGRGGQFESLIQSFRSLTPQETAAASRGRQVDVVTVRAGDTAESLAQRMTPPYNRVQSFLALNGIANRPVQPGERVKLIVG
jgi:predicted Zn-dependent protease